jgi:hypothetical protein
MTDLNHERGILRRQIKDDVINHFRAQRPNPPSPQQLFTKMVASAGARHRRRRWWRSKPMATILICSRRRRRPARSARPR